MKPQLKNRRETNWVREKKEELQIYQYEIILTTRLLRRRIVIVNDVAGGHRTRAVEEEQHYCVYAHYAANSPQIHRT